MIKLQKISAFRRFQIVLGVTYSFGSVLHALDIFGLRLNFSEMNPIWKAWILFLLVFDLIAALGLFLNKLWGEVAFVVVALTQLIAYLGFSSVFGEQDFLIWFHIVCLLSYIALKKYSRAR